MSVTYGYNTKFYIAGEPITATATTMIVLDVISDFKPQQYKSLMKSLKIQPSSIYGESEKHQRLARMKQRGPEKRGAWWNGKRRW